ncbi:MAG: hypothetical protein HQ526_04445, partial [Actinobacteria bacterium]|nr:hypothetical protein [Actinomycetota bacterium]
MMSRINRAQHSDEGATLILVLVMIFLVSLMSVAVLSFARTSLTAAGATQGLAEQQSDDAGAMSTGIQGVQTQIYDTRYRDVGSLACEPGQSTGSNTSQEYVTSCEPEPGNVPTVNTPDNAILTLGDSSQDGNRGIYLRGGGTRDLTINGDVFSNTRIVNTTGSGDFLANGFIETPDACAARIFSTRPNGAQQCRTPVPATTTDPNYSWPSSGTNLTKAVLPDIACAGPIVEFEPGYYGSATELNQIFSNNNCRSKVMWFPPGDYFFDFKDGQSPATAGQNPLWNINSANIRMVAGAQDPTYWAPTPSAANIYRACVAPATSGQAGANFIFGGRSQLYISRGDVAICGAYKNAGGQPQENQPATPVFGANANIGTVTPTGGGAGTDPRPRYADTLAAEDDGADPSCDNKKLFKKANDAQFWDDDGKDVATAKLKDGEGDVGSRACLEVTDFTLPADIEAGSVLVNASVMARAATKTKDSSGNKLIDFIVDGTGSGGSPAFTQFTTGQEQLPEYDKEDDTKDWGDDTVKSFDITSNLYDQVYDEGLSDLSLLLRAWKSAPANKDQSVGVDTVQIVLQWIEPSVANQNKTNYGATGTNGYGTWNNTNGTRNLSVAFYTNAGTPGGSGAQTVVADRANFSTSENNCVAATDFPSGSSCAFLRTLNT